MPFTVHVQRQSRMLWHLLCRMSRHWTKPKECSNVQDVSNFTTEWVPPQTEFMSAEVPTIPYTQGVLNPLQKMLRKRSRMCETGENIQIQEMWWIKKSLKLEDMTNSVLNAFTYTHIIIPRMTTWISCVLLTLKDKTHFQCVSLINEYALNQNVLHWTMLHFRLLNFEMSSCWKKGCVYYVLKESVVTIALFLVCMLDKVAT